MSKTTYKNCNAMPTWKMQEILNSAHTTGIDGADYHPVREELQNELYKRLNAESEQLLKQFLNDQKAQFRAQYRKGVSA